MGAIQAKIRAFWGKADMASALQMSAFDKADMAPSQSS